MFCILSKKKRKEMEEMIQRLDITARNIEQNERKERVTNGIQMINDDITIHNEKQVKDSGFEFAVHGKSYLFPESYGDILIREIDHDRIYSAYSNVTLSTLIDPCDSEKTAALILYKYSHTIKTIKEYFHG